MSYENGCNIGNVPDCHECEALEKEIEALRLQVKMMFTLDEIEAWVGWFEKEQGCYPGWEDVKHPQWGVAACMRGAKKR